MHNKLFGVRFLKFGRYVICAALICLLNCCDSEKHWQLDITGHLPDLHFSLISDDGKPVTDQTYQGCLVILFFGFTDCQEQCPTTMFRLAKIVQRLGDNANRVRILFITLNPSRDTPQVLQRYVAAFGVGHAVGLTGNESEIETLAKRYRIAYRPQTSGSDDITHSAAVYVFDPQGHARLLVTPDDAIETVVNDLLHLLKKSR